MAQRGKASLAWVLLMAITTPGVVLTSACRNQRQPGGEASLEPAGEPAQYSATVVRTIDDGATSEASITREVRSGEKRRQEWMERGQNRALIWRPDLGKIYLLDLDRRAYVEMEITAVNLREVQSGAGNLHDTSSAQDSHRPGVEDSTVQAIDNYFDDTPSPTRVEVRMLASVVIDGHRCGVYEQRASFLDGHTEITRRFRAQDLAGLALRIESESENGAAKVMIERRDVRIEAAPDAFVVPSDFNRVERL
jgi:hypothetical protein